MKGFLIILIFLFFLHSCSNNRAESVSDHDELPDTTNVVVKWDSLTKLLNSSQAWVKGSDIDLELRNKDSYESFFLELQNEAGRWKISTYISQPVLTDCLFVSSQFRLLSQAISVDKSQYKRGDSLKGSIDLFMVGKKAFFREPLVQFIDRRKWDTIKMKGVFSTVIN